ncbi:hypothetical protein [Sinanaerobacter sp. ZZT-01]|uniref:hypothetical protein n=1 Tax=Sinanaerobacter sp. ZZT-01 TaxID=3111540 RepID=UPI002D7A2627|nr:hypothetical protein [Sinanaerobacter sp. ZZT-01]WRR92696.1 hypothetical protein U5921_11665 [Sinanaerobacter sp. ZZT-01]
MLTRYRELYNKLTHSQAFKEDGQMDNSKINKGNFTPHNLKTIGFGANGALCTYFTTNNSTPRKIDIIRFKDLYTNDPEYLKTLKEDKGMIDALVDGLKSNYVEEILLFASDFTEEELQKEVSRLQRFATNGETAKTMKRLKGIVVVKDILTDDYLKLNPNKSIVDQLAKANVSLEVLVEFKPERNSLGLLLNQGLDTVQYPQDTKLANFFDEEQKRAEQAQKDKITDEKKKIEPKKVEEEQVEYDYQLINAVDSTIEKLEEFYAPLWGNHFFGLLHKDGIQFSRSDGKTNRTTLFNAMYKAWATIALNGADSESIDKFQIKYGVGYIPGFHFNVLKDKPMWDKSFKRKLTDELLKKYNQHFSTNPEKINEVEKGVTNCCIVKSNGKNQVILRMTGIDENNLELFKTTFDTLVGKTYLAGSSKGIIASATIEKGILNLTYIIDYESFKNEVLFAYKQYKTGDIPSLSKTLMGLKLDGTPLTVNLIDPRKMLTTIIAGSRSGKGTMTMGLLSTIFGSGGSVVYLDNKPDIAAMLWDLEREYSSQGLKLLALDVGKEVHEFTGATPVRSGPMNLIDEDKREESLFRTLRLAKLFQFFSFIGTYNTLVESKTGVDAKNLFFIIDELTSMNIDYTNLLMYANKQAKEYSGRALKKAATDEEKYLSEYYTKLNTILQDINSSMAKGFNKDWGMSGLKMIAIGQQLNSSWKVQGAEFTKSFAGRVIANSHTTFAGRLQANTDTYTFDEAQSRLANESGVFVLADKIPSPSDTMGSKSLGLPKDPAERFTQFRSYFSLIKNDFNYEEFQAEGKEVYLANHGKRFTSQFLGNYAGKSESTFNAVLNEIYDFENGCNRDEISFTGLLKVMQEKSGIDDTILISNMNKGYNLIDTVFRKMGIGSYSCVEEYLCDCSPESLFTQDELVNMFNGIRPMKKQDTKYDEDEVIDLFEDDEELEPDEDKEPKNRFETSTSKPLENTVKSKVATQPQPYSTSQKPVEKNKEVKIHAEPLNIDKSPYTSYKQAGIENTNIAKTVTLHKISNIIIKDIIRAFDGVDRITSFVVDMNEKLIINDVYYQPTFNESFINSLPIDLEEKVQSGRLAELFFFKDLFRFNNLHTFIIENEILAHGRIAKELGLLPRSGVIGGFGFTIGGGKKYSHLFKKFPVLQYIRIGSKIEYYRDNPDAVTDEDKLLDSYKKKPHRTIAQQGNGYSRMDAVWDSSPVRLMAGAFGWTMALKTAVLAATIFGPWGLAFGAIVAAKTYKHVKENIVVNSNSELGKKKEEKQGQSTKAKRNDKWGE